MKAPKEHDTMAASKTAALGRLERYAKDEREAVFLEVTIRPSGLYFSACGEPRELIPIAKVFMDLGWEVGVGT